MRCSSRCKRWRQNSTCSVPLSALRAHHGHENVYVYVCTCRCVRGVRSLCGLRLGCSLYFTSPVWRVKTEIAVRPRVSV